MSPLTPLSWQEHQPAGHMALGPETGWGDRIKFETEVHYLKGPEYKEPPGRVFLEVI